jgi:hypothetical protein
MLARIISPHTHHPGALCVCVYLYRRELDLDPITAGVQELLYNKCFSSGGPPAAAPRQYAPARSVAAWMAGACPAKR